MNQPLSGGNPIIKVSWIDGRWGVCVNTFTRGAHPV